MFSSFSWPTSIPPWVKPVFKSTAPFLLIHYLFIYQSSWLFSSTRAWYYALIAVCVLNGGQTVGGVVDASVLAMVGLTLGIGLGSLVITVFESPDLSDETSMGIAMTLLFLGMAWFGYLRTFSPRYFGFALNALLFPCIAVFVSRIGGMNNVSFPGMLQPAVGYLFGILVTACFNVLVFPDTAHNACRRFLTQWIQIIRKCLRLILRAYTSKFSAEEQESLQKSVSGLSQMITVATIIMNRVESEPCVSRTAAPVLIDLASELRSLTDVVLAIVGGLRLYQDWLSNREVDGTRLESELTPLANNIEKELNVLFDRIESLLSQSFSGKEDTNNKQPCASSGVENLVRAICEFESKQRIILDDIHKSHFNRIKETHPKEYEQIGLTSEPLHTDIALSLAQQSENIVSFYAFNILMEEFANKVVMLERRLKSSCSKILVYVPFKKWIPFWFFALPKKLFSLDHFYEGNNLSPKKTAYRLWQFTSSMDVVFALKMSTCVLLFLILYLHPSSRGFFISNGLSGTIINIAIIVSPTFGQSFFSAWIQIVGYMFGCLASVIVFYACGLRTEALWLPIFVLGAAGFWVLQNYPEHYGFAILFLIAFGSTNLTALTSLKISASTSLIQIFGRSLFVCCFGLAFGIVFTLLIFPRFATDELSSSAAHVLSHLQQLYRGTNLTPQESSKRVCELMDKKSKGALTESDYELEMTCLLEETRQRVESLKSLSFKTQSELLKLYELIEFASKEPNLKSVFPKAKWIGVVSSMQTVLSRLRGANIAMKNPWFVQPHIARIWFESAQGRSHLAETIHILYYLFEGAVTLQQPLPEALPDAVQVRDILLQQVAKALLSSENAQSMPLPLPVRMSDVINKNIQKNNEHIALLVDGTMEEQSLDHLWDRHRKQSHGYQTDTSESTTTEGDDDGITQDSALDIFYYAYVLFIRGAVTETDKLGTKLQDLFGKPSHHMKSF